MFLAIDTIKTVGYLSFQFTLAPSLTSRLISGFGSLSLLPSYKNKFHFPVQPCTKAPGMRQPCWSSYLCDPWGGPSAVPCLQGWENGPGHQLKMLSWCCAACPAFRLMWGLEARRESSLLEPLKTQGINHSLSSELYDLESVLWARNMSSQPPGFIHKRCTFCPGNGPFSPKGSTAGVCSSLDALLLCLPMPNLFLPSPEAICK